MKADGDRTTSKSVLCNTAFDICCHGLLSDKGTVQTTLADGWTHIFGG